MTAQGSMYSWCGCRDQRTGRRLARIKATLRAALNAAIRAGYLADNPACRAEVPSARRPRPVVWTTARVREWERTGIRPPVAVWMPAHAALFLNSIRATACTRPIT
jgi:hypothetical protein